jgi:aldose 1-epimerase
MNEKICGKLNGKEVYLFTLSNENIEIDICNLGARVNAIRICGTDIALGFNNVDEYLKSGSFAGATMGRVANRIAGGRFVLNGRTYSLNKNEGNNHLHGGNVGFHEKLFNVINQAQNSVVLTCESEDNDEDYPGKLTLTVTYTLKVNSLSIEYIAVSDKDTLWSPTNHTYFNLDGENSGNCRNNLLRINAEYYTPADDERIPTGEKLKVDGTLFDFRKAKKIGADFDQNFVLNGEHAARAESLKTGIKMDVYTDLPCMQFYSGGALKPCNGKTILYGKYAGFCLEPQYSPNAINMEGFEKPIIKKGEYKTHFIRFEYEYAKKNTGKDSRRDKDIIG